jgi:hypothetical protein
MIINPYIYGVATSYDADAQLFFNAEAAAGVTLTTTEKDAVNQWVVDSKAAGIWTKMKAVYPFVGSTATSQKFNLKNPADTNAAFRLVFSGGGTHSSNGYQLNGVNAFADTFLTPSTTLTLNSQHISFYSRTNSNGTEVEIGCNNAGIAPNTVLEIRTAGTTYLSLAANGYTTYVDANSLGFYIGNRTASNVNKLFKNNTAVATSAVGSSSNPINSIGIGALNSGFTKQYYSTKECAFSTIGDGLTDLESQLFYQITEKYQVALSRNINTTQSFYYNSAYNNETNAFLFSTQITDNTIQTATDTLVTDLKTAGVFTKMKAIYPMVGGTATTCKFNLVNPQDTNAAFRLTFFGGGTFSANGYQLNGTNSYANTFLTPSTAYSVATSGHMSYYSRTDSNGANEREMGAMTGTIYTDFGLRYSGNLYMRWGETGGPTQVASPNSLGFYVASRTTSTAQKIFKNGTQVLTSSNLGNQLSPVSFYLGCQNVSNSPINYSAKQCAFASIGDGLTDAEALAFYNAVQTFNTTLNRQV